MCKKMKGQLVHSLIRIDSFILLQSSKLFWGSSLLWFWVSSAIEARLGLKSAIDNWSTLHCQSTLITSKCDRLDRVMLLLAFLGSWGIIFVLATIGIVNCTFRRVGLRSSHFHSCVWETAVLLPSRWDGTERKHHDFFDCYCIYNENLFWMIISVIAECISWRHWIADSGQRIGS